LGAVASGVLTLPVDALGGFEVAGLRAAAVDIAALAGAASGVEARDFIGLMIMLENPRYA